MSARLDAALADLHAVVSAAPSAAALVEQAEDAAAARVEEATATLRATFGAQG